MALKGGLGRGLDTLFGENTAGNEGTVSLKLTDIEPNRNQPRRDFDEQSLGELADSISKHGLLQPIIVRPLSNGNYQIIAGERRWRACRMAGLDEVPVIVKELDDRKYMEVALIENLQRENLNCVEEAMGYRALIDNYGLTQDKVAEAVGKQRSTVANALRLLNLKEDELEALREGAITAGHARALLSCDDGEKRKLMLIAAKAGASVRELERMANAKKGSKSDKTMPKSNFYSEVELSLKNEIHRKVKVVSKGKGKGTLTIEFYSDEELSDFARKLGAE